MNIAAFLSYHYYRISRFSLHRHLIDTFASQFSLLLFFAVPYDDEQQQYHSHAIESRIVLYIYISINRNRIEFDWAVCIDLNFESSACHYETSGSMMWLLLEAAISTTISENVVRNRKNALNEWNCVNIWYANMIVDIFLLNFHICHISFEWFLSVTPNKKRQISNYVDWTQCCHFCCTYKNICIYLFIHVHVNCCWCCFCHSFIIFKNNPNILSRCCRNVWVILIYGGELKIHAWNDATLIPSKNEQYINALTKGQFFERAKHVVKNLYYIECIASYMKLFNTHTHTHTRD